MHVRIPKEMPKRRKLAKSRRLKHEEKDPKGGGEIQARTSLRKAEHKTLF